MKSKLKKDKQAYSIQSVAHALVVLEELAKSRGEQGVTEIAKSVDLHKNNVFRVLATLELFGYAKQNPESEQYSLGVKALHLGQSYLAQNSIYERAALAVRMLQDKSGETVSYGVLAAGSIIFPLSIEAKKSVRCPARIAASISAKNSATGRLLLATQNDADFADFIAGLTPSDGMTQSAMNDLRQSGLVVDKGGLETDVLVVSKALRAGDGTVLGALEICAPMYRTKAEDLVSVMNEVMAEFSTAGGTQKRSLSQMIERDSLTTQQAGSAVPPNNNMQVNK